MRAIQKVISGELLKKKQRKKSYYIQKIHTTSQCSHLQK
jgi:hypothetical protein